ncbi:hypothetical protein L6164_028439 [Bauhinia variegata]|uniref:Uncharacterized protein n=1 Tax=Bauhinia variegata TaxID=167791 RepID=A0ACB9L673_BAUVA|nr:hypothetical protein L6164_028439 [Bauhinia variegata]
MARTSRIMFCKNLRSALGICFHTRSNSINKGGRLLTFSLQGGALAGLKDRNNYKVSCEIKLGFPSHFQFGRTMASLATAEICDTNMAHQASGDLRVLQPVFQIYGQSRVFSGPVVTVKVFEDNVLVRELIETKGEGRVLVIDGGGSLRCALLGGNLAQLAQNMGWAGIVINGCIRDVDEINGCQIGVRALTSNPLKSNKKGTGEKHVPVYVAGTLIWEGEWLYADSDGILVSKFELSV